MGAIIYCGEEAPPTSLEQAAVLQSVARAYHASDAAGCPISEMRRVLVYSPGEQQWAGGKTKAAKAAVAIFDARDARTVDEQLLDWFGMHQYPGVLQLNIENFRNVVKGRRRTLVAAVSPKGQDASHSLVANRLRQVAKPLPLADGWMDEYRYTSDDSYIGVIDGSLPGMDMFGIYLKDLPRIFITEGFEQWVEDKEELTVTGLPGDLDKLPRLWRMRSGLPGKLIWLARELVRSYIAGENVAQAIAGPIVGRYMYIGFLLSLLLMYFRTSLFRRARSVARLFGYQGEEPTSNTKKVK